MRRTSPLERNHEAEEEDNEELLQSHATQVNVQPGLDNGGARFGTSHDATSCLDDEAENVGEDKPPGYHGSPETHDLALRVPIQHHTRKRHVGERVDPQRGEKKQELPDRGVSDLLLVSGADGVDDKGERLPYRPHDENPCVPLAMLVTCMVGWAEAAAVMVGR